MKSKEEITRLLATLAGALIGIGVGLGLMWTVFDRFENISEATGPAPLFFVVGLCGGGLIGGGYLGLWLVSRRQKAVRKKYFEEKKKRRKRGK
jgi:hypothetical protein